MEEWLKHHDSETGVSRVHRADHPGTSLSFTTFALCCMYACVCMHVRVGALDVYLRKVCSGVFVCMHVEPRCCSNEMYF